MMKGENKMGKKNKKNENGAMPMFQGGALPVPPVPFTPWGQAGSQESDDAKENFKSTMKSFWTQKIDRRKSNAENNKEQWKRFFNYMMEMQDTFTASLPEDTSSLPYGQLFLMSPKEVMKRLKEFEEMANKHFEEQADSFADFCIKGQEQLYDFVTTAMDNAKAKENEAAEEQAKAEDEAAK
jgi:hypothetical protein